MKKVFIGLSLVVSVLSCTQIVNKELQISIKNDSSSKEIYDNWIKKEQADFILKMKNKREKPGDVNFLINHNLISDLQDEPSFNIKYDNTNNGVLIRKDFDFSKHKTNKAHLKQKDKNIFDINNPETFPYEAYKGDNISELGSHVGAFTINDSEVIPFESEILILNFKTNVDLEYFKSKYNAQILQEEHGFYRMKVDLSKSPINNSKNLLDKLNNGITENIKDLEFTSLASLKTFLIGVDFLVNDYNKINSIEFSVQGRNDIVFPSKVEWDGGMNGVLGNRNLPNFDSNGNIIFDCVTNTNSMVNILTYSSNPPFSVDNVTPIVSSGWAWSSGNIDYVHNSVKVTGKGVTSAIIDGGKFLPSHPEIKEDGQASRITSLGENQSPNNCVSFGCGKDEESNIVGFHHGHACTMIAYGKRNVSELTDFNLKKKYSLGTTGIAPDANVIIYHHSFPFMWGQSIYKAIGNGAKVISLSMSVPNVGFLKYFQPVLASEIVSIFLRPSNLYQAITFADGVNVPVVMSAGNYKNDKGDNIPSDTDNGIIAGAVSPVKFEEDRLLEFSAKKNINNPSLKNRKRTLLDSLLNGNESLSQDACGVGAQLEKLSSTSSLSIPKYYLNNFDTTTNPIDRDRLGFSVADFSSYSSNDNVFWAPGKYIFVPNAKQTGKQAWSELNIYDRFDGTSSSAPYLAGAITLIKSLEPTVSTTNIKKILRDASIYQLRSSQVMMSKSKYSEYDPKLKMISLEAVVNSTLKFSRKLLPLTVKSISGTVINNKISTNKNTLDKEIKKLTATFGNVLFLGLAGDLTNPRVTIGGVTVPLVGSSGNVIAFEVSPQLSTGVKDVAVTTDGGTTTLHDSINIIRDDIVFDSGRDGNEEIYLMKPDGANQTRITNNPSIYDYAPDWNPEKTQIQYRELNANDYIDICTINPDGTGFRNLTNTPSTDEYSVTYSPNGSRFAYTSYQNGQEDIWVMNNDGSNKINLTSGSLADDYEASWSPDGSKIVFISERDGSPEVYIMNADGSNQTRLTQGATDNNSPVFLPDNSKIIYVSETRGDGTDQLWMMNPDGTGKEQLTFEDDYNPQVSPDGKKIMYQKWINANNIQGRVIDLETRAVTSITTDSFRTFTTGWLVDGSKGIFTSNVSGGNEIYTIKPDGTDLLRLTFNNSRDHNGEGFTFGTQNTKISKTKKQAKKIKHFDERLVKPKRFKK
ncbi:MAG: S8 family serine peptidase [Candidatus Sericytochromatia bacterium]